jgi:hypothetical protein
MATKTQTKLVSVADTPETRFLKMYLHDHCTQGNNWIVDYKIDEIAGHPERLCFNISTKGPIATKPFVLTRTNMSHIYFTFMTENRLISLIETFNGDLYLIHNNMQLVEPPEEEVKEPATEVSSIDLDQLKPEDNTLVKKVDTILPLPEITHVESSIYHLNTITDLNVCLSKNDRKLIGLNYKEWISRSRLASKKTAKVNGLTFLDFNHLSDEQQIIDQMNLYIDQCGQVLNLTHFYTITASLLKRLRVNTQITQLIMNQNFRIDDFEWLSQFPNLKLLNLFFCHQMEQRHFEQVTNVVPNLQVVNIHCCSRINLRVLIPLLKLHSLEKIAIDDPQFWCQKSPHELFILEDEWKKVDCSTLQKVAINSCNLTCDVIDYLIKACPSIIQFTVDDQILKYVTRNVTSGSDTDHFMIFNSWQNPQKGIKVFHKIKFDNLLKDMYETAMFSDSMMKKIKENRAKKGEAEQTAIVDRPKPHT